MIPVGRRHFSWTVLLLSLALVFGSGCTQNDENRTSASSTFTFQCPTSDGDSFDVVLQTGTADTFATVPERFAPRDRMLERVRAASGARYEGEDILVWNKGAEALVEIDGETFRGCTLERSSSVWQAARRRGVLFRGIGQEPGWVLEVFSDRLRFVGNYGERTMSVPRSGATVDSTARQTVYRTDRLDVVIENTPCSDVMSGESFSHTVTVTLDSTDYEGCGRPLP